MPDSPQSRARPRHAPISRFSSRRTSEVHIMSTTISRRGFGKSLIGRRDGHVGFAQWNERLLQAFFGEFAAHQPVRLHISRELLDSEFIDFGGAPEFGRVVRKGPDWPTTYTRQ